MSRRTNKVVHSASLDPKSLGLPAVASSFASPVPRKQTAAFLQLVRSSCCLLKLSSSHDFSKHAGTNSALTAVKWFHRPQVNAGIFPVIDSPTFFENWQTLTSPSQNSVLDNNKLSVDISVLAGLRDFQQAGEPDFVTELIDLFLRDTTWQLELVGIAVANDEVNEFRRLAHLVKGSSGNIGAKQLAMLCDAMENNELRNGAAGSLLLELENEFELVSSLLNAERQSSWAPLNAPRG